MNKKIVVFVVACVLFMAVCAHPHKHGLGHGHKFLRHFTNKIDTHLTKLTPGVVTEKTINWGEAFYVDVAEGEGIAVQIVRSSNKYISTDGKNPALYLCRHPNGSEGKPYVSGTCVSDEKNASLSFQVSADDISKSMKMKRKGVYPFSLNTFGSKTSGVVVDFYVCVGKNVSLDTCHTTVNINCAHGQPSKVMNACVCDKGYTGKHCTLTASSAPEVWEYDSNFDEVNRIIDAVCAIVFNVILVIFFIVLICFCCCLRACCARRRANRGRVVPNTAAPVVRPPPPPAYMAGAYHPLSVVPPPPPPPMPRVQPPPPPPPAPSTHRFNPYEGIELSTMPAKAAAPVYVMPPLAPVKQIPVYIIPPPPAPKN